MKPVIVLCVLFALCAGNAFSQWTSSGPSGGNVYCSVQIGGGLYIGTPAGIYRSLDSGTTFKLQSENLPGNNVHYLFYDGTTLYAGFDEVRGVYISNDTGKSWALSSSSMGSTFFSLNDKSFVMTNSRVFCTHSNGTYYTTDHGKSWIPLVLPTSIAQNGLPLFSTGNILFKQSRISSDYFLYCSVDDGANWTLSDSGLNQKEITGMFAIGNTIYAFNKERVFTSGNEGKNWKSMTYQPFVLPGGIVFWSNQIRYNGRRFFGSMNSGSNPGICSIEPGDSQWVFAKGLPSGTVYNIFTFGSNVLAGLYQSGNNQINLFMTKDDGDTWEKLNPGMGTLGINQILAEGSHVLAVSSNYLYRSDNGGVSWYDPVLLSFYPGCLHYFRNTLYASDYGIGKGILQSADYGESWSPTGFTKGNINVLANDGTNLFAGGNINNGSAAYKSADGGVTWNYFHSGWPAGSPMDMVVKGANVFAAVALSNTLPCVYRTPISSANWLAQNKGLPKSNSYSLALIGNTLYTGTANFGVFKSTDDGENWTAANAGIETGRVYSLAVSGNNLFAGTETGVFVLQGGSSQWESVTYNLPVKQISKIAVSDKFIYAATYNASVWQMPLKVLGIDKLKRNTFTLEVYPNPANTELSVGCSQLADCDWQFAKGDMIKVMDISGKLVESKMINEATENIKISTIDMVNGIYFIQVMKEGNIMTRKFLVMH